eukprot:TRINITY_DN3697_c0_g1_i2.p1 TRINITY_DN3697_c0_g1~~TRINITY_DN3697_c0_g1_i2.p1  ORF type:complete len:1262 (+),score=287.03 TRINITY_DN3697_c0_g1_i2:42-3827(+)
MSLIFSKKVCLPKIEPVYSYNIISEDLERSKNFFDGLLIRAPQMELVEENKFRYRTNVTLRNENECSVFEKKVKTDIDVMLHLNYVNVVPEDTGALNILEFDVHGTASVEWVRETLVSGMKNKDLKMLIGRTDLSESENPVTYEQGLFVAASCGAISYFETDGLNGKIAEKMFSHSISVRTIAGNIITRSSLDLSHLGIYVFPGFVSSNKALLKMDLSHNKISNINCQQLINEKFSGLVKIDLSHNRMKSIPPAFGTLQSLKSADLSYNLLETLPNTVSDCYNLKDLNLSNNNFLVIPKALTMLKGLEKLRIENNPFSDFVQDFSTKGVLNRRSLQNLMAYATALENHETSEFSRMKVMFVGEGGVGKTSLLNYMISNKPSSQDFNVATDGIDITEVKSNDVSLDCWDFAGQRLYYTTHQFFLTKKALYLVVFNVKEPNWVNIEYWLKSIRQREKVAPIFLVGTHLDQCTVEEAQLNTESVIKIAKKYKYDGIEVMSLTSKGKHVKALQEKLIEVGRTRRLLGSQVPTFYSYILNTIQDLKEENPWMYLEDFIKNLDYLNQSESDINQAISYLHDKGYLLHFREEYKFSDLVILDPQFLTNAMSSVVSLSNKFTDGRISASNLNNILSSYSPEISGKITSILEQFEVLFKLPVVEDSEQIYVVPCMLDPTPDYRFKNFKKLPENKKVFGRVYEFGFVPYGFFSRLIARTMTNPCIQIKSLWENGMIAGYKHQKIYMEYDPDKFTLTLINHVSKKGVSCAANLLATIIECVDSLMDVFYISDRHRMLSKIPVFSKRNPESDYIPHVTLRETISALIRNEDVLVDGEPVPVWEFAPDISKLKTMMLPEIENLEKLGEGGFGTVYRGTLNGEIVALKSLKVDQIEDELEQFQEFIHEVNVMRQFDHPNLVKLYGTTLNPLGMVIEYCPYKSLDIHLYDKNLSDENFPTVLRYKIMLDVAQGLECLHSFAPPVIHRDLRSPNVFISSMDLKEGAVNAKLGDFGLAQYALPSLSEMLISWQWLAPEVFSANNATYDTSADMYSFGMVFWEILTRDIPYSEFEQFINTRSFTLSQEELADTELVSSLSSQGYTINGSEVIQEVYKEHDIKEEIVKKHLRPTLPPIGDQMIRILIEKCWSPVPSERPTVQEAIDLITQAISGIQYGIKKDTPDTEAVNVILTRSPSSLIPNEMEYPEHRGELSIRSITGEGIPSYQNLYVKIKYDGRTYKTKQVKRGEEHYWEPDWKLFLIYNFTNNQVTAGSSLRLL